MPERDNRYAVPEGPPTTPPPTPEHQPGSYEQALESVRMMQLAGVEDPYDDEDERVQQALEPLGVWYYERGLNMRGVGTPEKASDIVRAARIFLDAGYSGRKFTEAALEKLRDEYADALREGGDGSVARIIGTAVDALENKLGESSPERKSPKIVAAKLEEADRLAEQGKAVDAVGILSLALIDPRFKRLPKEVLDRVRERRDTIKSRM